MQVGVVGLGIGVYHIRKFQECKDVQVAAVCDVDEQRAKAIANKYNIPRVFTDYRDLVRLSNLDIVSIATPPYLHYPMTSESLREGKNVLCEKPLAMNAGEARKMLEEAERMKLRHMTNFEFRYTPKLLYLKELVDSGYLGELYHVDSKYIGSYFADPNLQMNWRNTKREGGMGVLGDAGVHSIDMVRWTAGEFRRVCGQTARLIKERHDPATGGLVPTELDDSCMFMAELENSGQVLFQFSRCALFSYYISLDLYGRDGVLHYKHVSPDSEIPFAMQNITLTGARRDEKEGPVELTPLKKLDNPPSTFQLFVNGFRNDTVVSPSFVDGLKTQEIADAVLLSAREKRWVEISHSR